MSIESGTKVQFFKNSKAKRFSLVKVSEINDYIDENNNLNLLEVYSKVETENPYDMYNSEVIKNKIIKTKKVKKLPKEVMVIRFCDSDNEIISSLDQKLMLRNGNPIEAKDLKSGMLCMTRAEIKPLAHIGEVKCAHRINTKDLNKELEFNELQPFSKSTTNFAVDNGVFFYI